MYAEKFWPASHFPTKRRSKRLDANNTVQYSTVQCGTNHGPTKVLSTFSYTDRPDPFDQTPVTGAYLHCSVTPALVVKPRLLLILSPAALEQRTCEEALCWLLCSCAIRKSEAPSACSLRTFLAGGSPPSVNLGDFLQPHPFVTRHSTLLLLQVVCARRKA